MQTIEKALHQPMPFTTGGQTISDRLTAAKHSLAGSQLGKTICKATTEELMAPKKKHLDYLLHCTNEPNVSIPSMANLLIERTQHPSWVVVYKALITIHNIMCYGNERFSQYLASCNTTFNLGNFLDKNSMSGYDMSQNVRKYGSYIGQKIATYRVCAFDFCKVKRGREDGLLRTMHTDKLLKTLPILQNQIDALLEFQISASELNNGVINCSFILLFRDLIRLFACYNDGIINLLEKYFDMNKKQCREALDTYKGFLMRLDKVSDFLRVAETVGIEKGEIPDLTRAPASLLEALEAHLIHLEGGRVPPTQQTVQSQVNNFSIAGGFQAQPAIGEAERQKYLEYEKIRLQQFEAQRQMSPNTVPATSQFNPFASDVASGEAPRPSGDLLDFFSTAPPPQAAAAVDGSNPFAQFVAPSNVPSQQPQQPMYSNVNTTNTAFGADFSRAFSATTSAPRTNGSTFDPFNTQAKTTGDVDTTLSSLTENLSLQGSQMNKPVQWSGMTATGQAPARPPAPPSAYAAQTNYNPAAYAPRVPGYGMPVQQPGYPQAQMGQMPQWSAAPMMQQQPGMYAMPTQQPYAPYGYGGQMPAQSMQQAPPKDSTNPFAF